MLKRLFMLGVVGMIACTSALEAHCQMPCGIYHDDMVFDQVDQYVETMYKGISILNENKSGTVKDKNEFVRWVILKEKASDETAQLLTTYFLQQKIKPGEADTAQRLASVHKLMFNLVLIKQNVDLKFVESFADEWEKFKLMFHIEGYECKVEQLKLKQRAQKEKEQQSSGDHVHDHDHAHDHDHDHMHDH